MSEVTLAELPRLVAANMPDCSDKDEECPSVVNKVKCWLHAPELGMCPYLRATPALLPPPPQTPTHEG